MSNVNENSSASNESLSAHFGGHKTEVTAKVAEMRRLFVEVRQSQFAIGDIAVDLADNYGCKVTWMADQVGASEATISSYAATARAFMPETRMSEVCFYRHAAVANAAKRVEARAEKASGKPYKIDAAQALKDAIANNLKTPHEIVKFLRDKAREVLKPDLVAEAALSIPFGDGLIGVPHHADYRAILEQLPLGSIQMAHLDPPYSDYVHVSPIDPASAGMSSCDNDNPEAAIEVACAAFPLLRGRLAPNGVILLWQSSKAMRPQIYEAIEDNGFEVEICVIWDKKRPQAGYPDSAWTYRTEHLYVIRRVGERLVNYDGSARDNIIQFGPVQHNRASIDLTHGYEKPIDLCKFLIQKHSVEGHLIFDGFGCSASFCVAAHQLGRKWVYCESNADNHRLGVERLTKEVGDKDTKDAA